ncbi:hypothetical protein RRG08_048224 [Elysia crispata]|uniref:Uncharacterized protein n=1 Tax=Elysia crispata TaxID=231223 RepID=A0AAE1CQC2_9GAST|nr:hypothetical protein RRG08_048224 [Elysia crispata]
MASSRDWSMIEQALLKAQAGLSWLADYLQTRLFPAVNLTGSSQYTPRRLAFSLYKLLTMVTYLSSEDCYHVKSGAK